MNIRQIRAGDMNGVFDVRTATRQNRVSMDRLAELGITPASVAEALSGPCRGWACEENRKILGFTIGNGDTGEVTVLAVLPEAEGRGIGGKLMREVQDWLFYLGHRQLRLEENPNPAVRAFGFYRKLGWEPTGEFRDNGDQVLTLERKPQ